MLTVHVRVIDAATGKPTPVRIRFMDAAGRPHVPLGRLPIFPTAPGVEVGGQVRVGLHDFSYIDGACEVRLSPGPVTVEAFKGPEYLPLSRTITLGPGQIALRVAMERWTDLRAEGWYSGDTGCVSLSPHAALLEGAAEDLAVVNLLADERPPAPGAPAAITNLIAFSGTKPCLESPGHLVAVNTLNVHPVLGSVALLDSHRPVFPLRSGAPDRADDWSVADWCDQCHRKRGLVVWTHLLPRLTEFAPQGEALAALLLGKIDAFEVSRLDDPEPDVLADWYRLLDCGLRVPLVGGSGKDSNAIALGAVRTYARLADGQPFGYAAWVDAVKAGRTFVTNGPLLNFTADGFGPGATLPIPAEGKTVSVRVEARWSDGFDRIELLFNSAVVASKEASGNRQSTALETELTPTSSGWLAARCWSRARLPDRQCAYAHSSPVYLQMEGRPLLTEQETVAPLIAVLDRTLAWVATEARCDTEGQREHLLEVLRGGRERLIGRA